MVQDLCQISRGATLDFALRVGELIFQRVFGGDIDAVRRRGFKDRSFRKLAAHPLLPFSAATLWRSVAIFELVQRFPGILNTTHLGVTHLRAVLGLPSDAQESLLRAAEKERWTKDRLEERAAAVRRRAPSRGGVGIHRVVKAIERVDRVAAQHLGDNAVCEMGLIEPEQVRRALTALDRLRSRCEVVGESLKLRLDPTGGPGTPT